MTQIFAEWLCRICKGTHRINYDFIVDPCIAFNRPVYRKGDIIIDDPAYTKANKKNSKGRLTKHTRYAVYVSKDISMKQVIDTLKDYIREYYTTLNDTVKVDVCFD